MNFFTLAQLQRVMPHANARAATFQAPLNQAMESFAIDTPKRQAAFIAQIAHESAELLYTKELGSDERFTQLYEGRKDLGNTEPGDGARFPGRGLIQITGRANHLACGQALSLDLIGKPELLETPVPACASSGWFWVRHGLNQLADENRFFEITHRINGGYNGGDQRLAYYLLLRSFLLP